MIAPHRAALSGLSAFLLAVLRLSAQDPAPAAEPPPKAVISPHARMEMVRLFIPDDAWLSIHIRLPEARIMGDRVLEESYHAMQNTRFRSAYRWLDLAVNFVIREKWDRALVCFQKANEIEDYQEDFGLFRAWLIEMSGDWPAAMSLYERLIQEFPADKIPKQRQVCCALKLYQPDLAARLLRDQMALSPLQPENHHLLALTHILLGDIPTAMLDLRKSIEMAGHLSLAEAYAAMALCEMINGFDAEACGWLAKAIKRADPKLGLRLMGRAEWNPLRASPRWAVMLDHHSLTDLPAGAPPDQLAAALTEGAAYYRNKYRIPASLRVNLRLRVYEPYTTYRTLRDKVNFEATRPPPVLEREDE